MKYLLNITALALIFIWSFGFIGYGIGGAFHLILILAIALAAIKVSNDLKVIRTYQSKRYKMTFKLLKIKLIN